jgi:type IX secretion system substrate protein
MKKIIFGLIMGMVINTNINLKAQTWAQSGATWYYSAINIEYPPFSGYDKFEKIGDTLVGGKLCDNLLETIYGWDYSLNQFTTSNSNQFTYQSDDTVYYWAYNKFWIYAIYSAQVGDTWVFAQDTQSCQSQCYFLVDSLGQKIIGSDTLPIWYLTVYNDFTGSSSSVLIKKIGFDFTMFPKAECYIDYFQWGPFRCYNDSSGLSYSSGIVSYCDSTVGIENVLTSNNTISIYPNPTKGIITLSFNSQLPHLPSQLIITDIQGRAIYKTTWSGENNSIDVSGFSNGMYFYRIIAAKETLQGKFVKE